MAAYIDIGGQDFDSWYYAGITAASLVAITQEGKEMFGFSFILLDYFRRREGQMIMQSKLQYHRPDDCVE